MFYDSYKFIDLFISLIFCSIPNGHFCNVLNYKHKYLKDKINILRLSLSLNMRRVYTIYVCVCIHGGPNRESDCYVCTYLFYIIYVLLRLLKLLPNT